MNSWRTVARAKMRPFAVRRLFSWGSLTPLATLECFTYTLRVVFAARKACWTSAGPSTMRAGIMPPAYATGDQSCARDVLRENAARNDDLIAERIGSLARDGGSGLSRCHVLMRMAIVPKLDWLVIRHAKVDGKNPATSPLAQLARPLMGYYVVGSHRHSEHASRPEARGLGLDSRAQDAAQVFGGGEMHKHCHASSIWVPALSVKDATRRDQVGVVSTRRPAEQSANCAQKMRNHRARPALRQSVDGQLHGAMGGSLWGGRRCLVREG